MIAPADLSPEQRPLYDSMRDGIEKYFRGFASIANNGALMGPWAPRLHEPKFGKLVWISRWRYWYRRRCRAMRGKSILVTGTTFHSGYELYAHVFVAETRGLSDDKLSTITAGHRPSDLTLEEAIAYDVASSLMHHGTLPEINYRQAVKQFGVHGAAELIYLVGLYSMISVTLNGFNVPVPDAEAQ